MLIGIYTYLENGSKFLWRQMYVFQESFVYAPVFGFDGITSIKFFMNVIAKNRCMRNKIPKDGDVDDKGLAISNKILCGKYNKHSNWHFIIARASFESSCFAQ